ncbi:MAG: amidohydrolase family protein [Deltaproteobacteria bacterium]|nr:amidohydrolase family protein [Deltaproteobacteria bacterium]MBW2137037.1 amidohydrolase family protein [Deltaproteobacteria bacterium]
MIDFHVHIFPDSFIREREAFFAEEPGFKWLYDDPKANMSNREELIRVMDEEGVDKAVVFGFPWRTEDYFRRHNDYILESVHRHPERLIGFCCFSPTSPKASKETERCLESGLSGVGEIGFYDVSFEWEHIGALGAVMGLCREKEAPFVLHANEPVGHGYKGKTRMDLGLLYQFIRTYPSNRIVLAHWGGGLLFFALLKKEVREALARTWFDTAASPFLYRRDIYRVAGDIAGFDKILFGSDYPLLRPARYLDEMKETLPSPEFLKMITFENASRLLRLAH